MPIKGWLPPGCHTPALGGVALVGDPHLGLEVVHAVVLHHRLGVAHDFEHYQVAGVGQHKGPLLAKAGVKGAVEPGGVAVDELILQGAALQAGQALVVGKTLQGRLFGPHKVAHHVRGLDLQAEIAIVALGLHRGLVVHLQIGADALGLDLFLGLRVQQGHLQDVVVFQGGRVHPQLAGVQAGRGDTAALAVAPVVHLDGGLEDVPPAQRHAGREAHHTAAAFLGGLHGVDGRRALYGAAAGGQDGLGETGQLLPAREAALIHMGLRKAGHDAGPSFSHAFFW